MFDPVALWSEILTRGKEKEHIVRRDKDQMVSGHIPRLNPLYHTYKILLSYLNFAQKDFYCILFGKVFPLLVLLFNVLMF